MTSGQGGGPDFPGPGWGTPSHPYGPAPYQGGPIPGGGVPPGGPAPWQPYGPGPVPPKKSRAGLIIALATAGAVIVFGGLAVLVGLSSGGTPKTGAATAAPSGAPEATPTDPAHSIGLPASVGDYRRITGSVADRLAQNMRKSMGKSGSTYAKAKIGIYLKKGDAGQPLVFVGRSGGDIPDLAAELRARSASEEVDSISMGMGVTDTSDFPAGPLGGVLRCGKGVTGGNAACAWADGSVVGMVLTPTNSDPVSLGATTLALRNAAEH
ncbi:MAG: hypothetical protein ACJ72W_20075 [Actinoallomurus sp.]